MDKISISSPIKSYKPIASLGTISFSRLFNRNAEETTKLVAACEKDGFFYLDLTDPSSSKLFRDLGVLDGVVREWFAQPLSEKMKTVTVSNAHGSVILNCATSIHSLLV